MASIADIRLTYSDVDNLDAYAPPVILENERMKVYAHRCALALRAKDFSLGDFEQLFINFTTSIAPALTMLASRVVTNESAHMRYVDVGVTQEQYEKLAGGEMDELIRRSIRQVLVNQFGATHSERKMVRGVLDEVDEKGERLLLPVMEKKSLFAHAVVEAYYLDSGIYQPLLRAYDRKGRVVLEKALPEAASVEEIGDVRLGMRSITVAPPKKDGAEASPVTFEIGKA